MKQHHASILSDKTSFAQIDISDGHLDAAIEGLKTGKSCGSDGIYAEMLKSCENKQLREFILNFYDTILKTGDIPGKMSEAKIIPLVKDRKKGYDNPNNYRPISLISIFSKIFDLLILQLCPFLRESSTLQHGFKKNGSTMHAAYAVRATIDHYASEDQKLYACTLDAEKAFDVVTWYGLFYKLMDRLPPLLWLALHNYYITSSFIISYNDVISLSSSISRGVKQVGVLSPHLFSFLLMICWCRWKIRPLVL